MLTREDIIQTLKARKQELRSKFPLKSIALFGSYARGDQSPESDIDFLVEFDQPVGIEFIDLIIYLEEVFGKRVDLVTTEGLKKVLKPYVEKDLVYV